MNKCILYREKKLFYQVEGKGNPVILVHGFGETASVWMNQVDFLKKHFQLFIPDLPGSGQSELIDDMSLEELAESIHTIIHEEDIENCNMLGHSMGGYITLAFAEKYPNHLQTFGLIHSTAFADSIEKKEIRKKGITFIKEHGALEFLKTASPNLFSPETKTRFKNKIDDFIDSVSGFSKESLISYTEAMMIRPDRTHILKDATTPVLIVAGEHDTAVTLEDILKQVYLPAISHIHFLKNSGHMGMIEEPEKLNKVLLEFLS